MISLCLKLDVDKLLELLLLLLEVNILLLLLVYSFLLLVILDILGIMILLLLLIVFLLDRGGFYLDKLFLILIINGDFILILFDDLLPSLPYEPIIILTR